MTMLTITHNCKYKVGPNQRQISKEFNISEPINYNQNMLDKLYNTIHYLIKELEKYMIDYFAIGGTLLGAIRHQGFIPWDLDIDIGIFKDGYDKINKNIKKLNKADPRYQWVDTKVPGIRIYFNEKAIVDIFVMDVYTKDSLGMYVYSAPYIDNKPIYSTHKMFPKIKCSKEILIPIKKTKFENILINIPNNPEKFLELNYNKNCLTTIIKPPQEHKFLHSDINLLDYKCTSELWRLAGSKAMLDKVPTYFELYENIVSRIFRKTFKNYGVDTNKDENIISGFKLLLEIPTLVLILGETLVKIIKDIPYSYLKIYKDNNS